ncbi:MAG: hypothetical protein NTZ33_12710 [Bacteroidetes bacterium]|nr:hypothetical protein [Bacteroidota bacterium]
MKTIKLATILCLLMSAISVFSQPETERVRKTPEEKLKMQLNAINKECNLSNEQSVKVEKILSNSQQELQALRDKKPAQRGERLIEAKTIADKQNEEIKKVLTAEQFTKYTALLEKQKEKMRERMMERSGEAKETGE